MPTPEPALEPIETARVPLATVGAGAAGAEADPYEVDDPFAAIAEAAAREETYQPHADTPRCPQCQSAMGDGAVLCINCGYDSRTGKRAAAATVVKAPPAAAAAATALKRTKDGKIDYMAPTGSLMAGTILSAVLALAASAIWIGVAYATGYAIGYIAILIGVAAGIGMQAGHKGTSTLGGYVAGTMTLGAIFFAKIVVIYLVLQKMGIHRSMWDLNGAVLGLYFFNPMGLIIIAIGVGAAFRTASGTSGD
jgi:hypothetical protein